MAVRWGKIVTDSDQADRAAAEGFDFVQPVGELLAGWGDEEFRRQRARIAEGAAAFEVCAVPLPSKVRVTQKGFNLYVWAEHLKRVFPGIAGLGCRKLVWSDGSVPTSNATSRTCVPSSQSSMSGGQVMIGGSPSLSME